MLALCDGDHFREGDCNSHSASLMVLWSVAFKIQLERFSAVRVCVLHLCFLGYSLLLDALLLIQPKFMNPTSAVILHRRPTSGFKGSISTLIKIKKVLVVHSLPCTPPRGRDSQKHLWTPQNVQGWGVRRTTQHCDPLIKSGSGAQALP